MERVEGCAKYRVDFYDAFDGWCGIKEYEFMSWELEKAEEKAKELQAELGEDNKRMGEHWGVINLDMIRMGLPFFETNCTMYKMLKRG